VFAAARPKNADELIAQTRTYLIGTQKRPDIVRAYFEVAPVNYAAR
jgi:hypothetical protein